VSPLYVQKLVRILSSVGETMVGPREYHKPVVVHASSRSDANDGHRCDGNGTSMSDRCNCLLDFFSMRQADTGHKGAMIALRPRACILYETYLVDVKHMSPPILGSLDRRHTRSKKWCGSLSSLECTCCVPNDHRLLSCRFQTTRLVRYRPPARII
jgi:hypothetical protein